MERLGFVDMSKSLYIALRFEFLESFISTGLNSSELR